MCSQNSVFNCVKMSKKYNIDIIKKLVYLINALVLKQ